MVKGILQESLAKAVLILSGLILNIFFARKLGPSAYGIIGILTSVLFFFELFLTNGIRQAVSKILSSTEIDEKDLWKKSILFQMVLSILLIIIGLLITNKLAIILNIERYKNYLYLIYALIPLKAIFFLSLGFLNGKRLFKQHALTNVIYSLSRMFFSILLLLQLNNGVLSVLLGTLFAYLVSFFYLRRRIPLDRGNDVFISIHNLLNLVLGALLFYFLINILLNIDILLLRSLGTNEMMIGVYKANTNIGIVLYYFFASILQVSYPSTARLFSLNLFSQLRKLINSILIMIVFMTSFGFIFTYFYTKLIISLFFGNGFLSSVNILPWYISGIGFLSIVILLGNLLIAFDHKKYYLIYLFGSLCFFVLLTYLLYDHVLLLSAPISLIISSLITIFILVYLLNKKNGKVINLKRLMVICGWLAVLIFFSIQTYRIFTIRINNIVSGIVILILFVFISLASVKDIRVSITESINSLLGKIN